VQFGRLFQCQTSFFLQSRANDESGLFFKDLKSKYNLKIENFSSHSLRKCFGREIFNRSGSNAELALVKLSHLFNHSNPAITRRYLGVSQKELLETYDILSF
jgi:hypothetical protein